MKILIVDDEEILLEVLAELIESAGFEVISESNSQRAAELINSSPDIDLLITDANMPGLKGPDLAALFHSKKPDARICILSGHLDASGVYAEKCVGLPVTFVTKPVESKVLIDWISAK